MIPLLLRDEARKWFTRVYRQRRVPLNTWEDYKDALRRQWLGPNHQRQMKRKWKTREWKPYESMTAYFDDKVDLQRYAFANDELDVNLIDNIIQGMPEHMHPTLQNAVQDHTTLRDFRRVLKNYEKVSEL